MHRVESRHLEESNDHADPGERREGSAVVEVRVEAVYYEPPAQVEVFIRSLKGLHSVGVKDRLVPDPSVGLLNLLPPLPLRFSLLVNYRVAAERNCVLGLVLPPYHTDHVLRSAELRELHQHSPHPPGGGMDQDGFVLPQRNAALRQRRESRDGQSVQGREAHRRKGSRLL